MRKIPMYKLIEYSDNYSETAEGLSQYCRDKPNDNRTDSVSHTFEEIITGRTPDNCKIKIYKITVTSKYLSNFWSALQLSLFNCKTYLILSWQTK